MRKRARRGRWSDECRWLGRPLTSSSSAWPTNDSLPSSWRPRPPGSEGGGTKSFREKGEREKRETELKKLKKKQEEFRDSGFQQVLLNTALRCYCLKSHQWRYGNIKINKWINPKKSRKSTPFKQHILFLSHSKHRNNSHPFTLTHTEVFLFLTPLSHSFEGSGHLDMEAKNSHKGTFSSSSERVCTCKGFNSLLNLLTAF